MLNTTRHSISPSTGSKCREEQAAWSFSFELPPHTIAIGPSAPPTFFGWVFGFNGKVQILAPESVKEQYRQMIAKADEDMQESE